MRSIAVSAVLILTTCFIGMIDPGSIEYYNGAVVVHVQRQDSFQLGGFIFAGAPEHIPHEYGHYLQEIDKGFERYIVEVAMPSVLTNVIFLTEDLIHQRPRGVWASIYNALPWEAEADRLSKEFRRVN